MKVFPTQDRIIVRPWKGQETTRGGIVLPASAQQAGVQRGTILEVGPGSRNTLGHCPIRLDPGVDVFYGEYAGNEIDVDGEKLRVLSESDVLAVVGE